jgi:hypothetical protein
LLKRGNFVFKKHWSLLGSLPPYGTVRFSTAFFISILWRRKFAKLFQKIRKISENYCCFFFKYIYKVGMLAIVHERV